MDDKNKTFILLDPAKTPKEISISESSKIFFIPPEIFQQYNLTREFIARNVSLEEIYENTFIDARELRYLILSFNKLKNLVNNIFKNLSHLESLKLQHNEISVLLPQTFFGLGELRSLVLSFNKIQNLPLLLFNTLKSLEELKIDNNAIAVLSGEQFHANLELMQLNFENNKLQIIGEGAFGLLTKLEKLILFDNICIDTGFGHWKADNESLKQFSCCAEESERPEECFIQVEAFKMSNHYPLILLIFISTFVNILLGSLYYLHKRQSQSLLDNDFEMAEDLKDSVFEVYW